MAMERLKDAHDVSERRVRTTVLNIDRSNVRYRSQPVDDADLRKAFRRISRDRRRFRYRSVHVVCAGNPRRMSVTPAASQTRVFDGTGIKPSAPEPDPAPPKASSAPRSVFGSHPDASPSSMRQVTNCNSRRGSRHPSLRQILDPSASLSRYFFGCLVSTLNPLRPPEPIEGANIRRPHGIS